MLICDTADDNNDVIVDYHTNNSNNNRYDYDYNNNDDYGDAVILTYWISLNSSCYIYYYHHFLYALSFLVLLV